MGKVCFIRFNKNQEDSFINCYMELAHYLYREDDRSLIFGYKFRSGFCLLTVLNNDYGISEDQEFRWCVLEHHPEETVIAKLKDQKRNFSSWIDTLRKVEKTPWFLSLAGVKKIYSSNRISFKEIKVLWFSRKYEFLQNIHEMRGMEKKSVRRKEILQELRMEL